MSPGNSTEEEFKIVYERGTHHDRAADIVYFSARKLSRRVRRYLHQQPGDLSRVGSARSLFEGISPTVESPCAIEAMAVGLYEN